jgi:hypothetical protein
MNFDHLFANIKSYKEPSIISGIGDVTVQNLILVVSATITLKVVPICAYALYATRLPFLNAFWKLCSVRMISTACDFASITSDAGNRTPIHRLQSP